VTLPATLDRPSAAIASDACGTEHPRDAGYSDNSGNSRELIDEVVAGRRVGYSLAMARRMSRRDARRPGPMAATIPARAATTATTSNCWAGITSRPMP